MVPETIRLSGRNWDNVVVLDPGHRTTPTSRGAERTARGRELIEADFVGAVATAMLDLDDTPPVYQRTRREDQVLTYTERADMLVKIGLERPLALIHLHLDACAAEEPCGTWAITRSRQWRTSLATQVTGVHVPRPDTLLRRRVRGCTEPIAARARNVMEAFSKDGLGVFAYEQILVELGFVTNDDDFDFFTTPGAVETVAENLHAAIKTWHEGLVV